MKIAIDCRLIGSSGIGTFIENVVRHMTANPDLRLTLIGNKDTLKDYSGKSNCKIVECTHKSFTLKELFCFPSAEVNRCDAFFTPNFNIPSGIKIPIFSTIHDVVFFDVKETCSPPGRFIRRLFISRALHISRHIFTVSHFSASRISNIFNYRSPITVIPNGISRELATFKNTCQSQKKDKYIVCLGNLKRHKGINVLIDAYNKARMSDGFDHKLYIVGRFDFRTKDPHVVRLLNRQNDNISFITDANNQEVYKLLQQAAGLVSPSFYEGFGIPPLEAMYLGTPVIISDIPAYQEIYGNSPALFFKAGDSDDLARKLLLLNDQKSPVVDEILKEYDYARAAEIIVSRISAEE